MKLLATPFRLLLVAAVFAAPVWCCCNADAAAIGSGQAGQAIVLAEGTSCHRENQSTTPFGEPAAPCSDDCSPHDQVAQDVNVALVSVASVASYDLLSLDFFPQVLFQTPATPISRIASHDQSAIYHGDSLRALSRLLTV